MMSLMQIWSCSVAVAARKMARRKVTKAKARRPMEAAKVNAPAHARLLLLMRNKPNL